ncbi:hypothetical protein EDC26_103264 [Paralcaligenes ureilyticus]|uniref:Transposase IS66-like protein n=1 Tax=Paralcaligenes ureilyticus TaxID=627131 RepID=A0A4R3MDP0_9BURK|nr:hypothetical protein EDC26_103264 [Paralcaligenes ureilyticus]
MTQPFVQLTPDSRCLRQPEVALTQLRFTSFAVLKLREDLHLQGCSPDGYHVLTVLADHSVNRIDELLPWSVTL